MGIWSLRYFFFSSLHTLDCSYPCCCVFSLAHFSSPPVVTLLLVISPIPILSSLSLLSMVVWHSTVRSRSRVTSPSPVEVLCQLFDEFNSLITCKPGRFSCPVYGNGSKNDIIVTVFTSTSSLAESKNSLSCPRLFFDVGGLLISTSLAAKWHNRQNFLLDVNFWRLWDVIVMRAGWYVVDISSFVSLCMCDPDQCVTVIPLLPSLAVIKQIGVAVDSLSNHTLGYSLFWDVLCLFKHFVTNDQWGVGSKTLKLDCQTSAYLDYQVNLLDKMLFRLSQPADILHVMLDLNQWGVCNYSLASYVTHDSEFELPSIITHMMLVIRYSLVFSNTATHCSNIIKYCNIHHI